MSERSGQIPDLRAGHVPDRAKRLDWRLDALNFLLADVRGGLGPYVGVFLITRAGWEQSTLGTVLTVSGLIGIALHAPIGALIDTTRAKLGLLAIGVILLALASIAIVTYPTLPVVFAADVGMAVLGAVFAPIVAALTMGLVSRAALARRFGRNAAFDKLGNVFIAGLAAAVGSVWGQEAVFWLVPALAVPALAATLAIPVSVIDHQRARGLDLHGEAPRSGGQPGQALGNPPTGKLLAAPFLVLAGLAATFHFVNAPVLNMVAQKLALSHSGQESALTAAAVVIGQMPTVPAALLLARAETAGRTLFLALALGALPLRCLLFAATDAAPLLLAGQMLDGFGGGLFDALLPLLLADCVRGSGRYTFARGVLGTVQGVGGSLSNVVSGMLVSSNGYNATFLVLGVLGFLVLIGGMFAWKRTGIVNVSRPY
ncbi:MFS transporter [Nostoc sp. NIES-2111]